MGTYEYIVADAFTSTPLHGNPVAVFVDATGLSTTQMQQIALEMHLSETVFVLPPEHGADIRVRIFTPVNELPFAGHPTLGAAIALDPTRPSSTLTMETAMGHTTVRLERDATGAAVAAVMTQPIPTWQRFDAECQLLRALKLAESTLPIEVYNNGPRHVFVGLPSAEFLTGLTPDHTTLALFPDLAVNCFAQAGDQWELRMFSPAYGVVEDAATGSAAGSLAVHLARHHQTPYGKWITISQGVHINRPSTMRARAEGEGHSITRVEVAGSAVTVARGHLFL